MSVILSTLLYGIKKFNKVYNNLILYHGRNHINHNIYTKYPHNECAASNKSIKVTLSVYWHVLNLFRSTYKLLFNKCDDSMYNSTILQMDYIINIHTSEVLSKYT